VIRELGASILQTDGSSTEWERVMGLHSSLSRKKDVAQYIKKIGDTGYSPPME
jgi:hypothetical protein